MTIKEKLKSGIRKVEGATKKAVNTYSEQTSVNGGFGGSIARFGGFISNERERKQREELNKYNYQEKLAKAKAKTAVYRAVEAKNQAKPQPQQQSPFGLSFGGGFGSSNSKKRNNFPRL
jgi:hypothetical protein